MNAYPHGQTIDLGPLTLRDATGETVAATTVTGTVTTPSGDDVDVPESGGAGVYHFIYTPSEVGVYAYRALATTGDLTAVLDGTFTVYAAVPFVTPDELAQRLGVTLSDAQVDTARVLCFQATAAIVEAVDETDSWAAALDPVPQGLRSIALDVAVRAFNVPAGIRSEQTTLGSYSHNVSYPDAAAMGVQLTAAETLRVRRIVHGSNAAGATAETAADDLSTYYPESWPT
mgnify:CR=1 FL=1